MGLEISSSVSLSTLEAIQDSVEGEDGDKDSIGAGEQLGLLGHYSKDEDATLRVGQRRFATKKEAVNSLMNDGAEDSPDVATVDGTHPKLRVCSLEERERNGGLCLPLPVLFRKRRSISSLRRSHCGGIEALSDGDAGVLDEVDTLPDALDAVSVMTGSAMRVVSRGLRSMRKRCREIFLN